MPARPTSQFVTGVRLNRHCLAAEPSGDDAGLYQRQHPEQGQSPRRGYHYDDSVGYSALLLEGRYPQPQMRNKRGRELCLFQRSSGRASVSEADQLRWVK